MPEFISFPDYVFHNLTVRLSSCGFTDIVLKPHPKVPFLFCLHCRKDGVSIDRIYTYDDADWLPVCKPLYYLPDLDRLEEDL